MTLAQDGERTGEEWEIRRGKKATHGGTQPREKWRDGKVKEGSKFLS